MEIRDMHARRRAMGGVAGFVRLPNGQRVGYRNASHRRAILNEFDLQQSINRQRSRQMGGKRRPSRPARKPVNQAAAIKAVGIRLAGVALAAYAKEAIDAEAGETVIYGSKLLPTGMLIVKTGGKYFHCLDRANAWTGENREVSKDLLPKLLDTLEPVENQEATAAKIGLELTAGTSQPSSSDSPAEMPVLDVGDLRLSHRRRGIPVLQLNR